MNPMSELYGERDKSTFMEQGMRNRYDKFYNCHFVTFLKLYCVAYDLICTCNYVISVFRKAKFMCEERLDDIPKLWEFFRRCKNVNEYFYWDAQIDG
jgi:hypothetical protein